MSNIHSTITVALQNTQRFKRDERSAPMRSGSPAQSCGHRGRRSTAAAIVAEGVARTSLLLGWCLAACIQYYKRFTGLLRILKALWKDSGREKSLLISYGIHRRRRVCVWSKRWARISAGLRKLLDSRRWRRRRNYHSLMSPIGTAIRRRTTVKYHRPSTSTVLWTVSYSLGSFPVFSFACITSFLLFY